MNNILYARYFSFHSVYPFSLTVCVSFFGVHFDFHLTLLLLQLFCFVISSNSYIRLFRWNFFFLSFIIYGIVNFNKIDQRCLEINILLINHRGNFCKVSIEGRTKTKPTFEFDLCQVGG